MLNATNNNLEILVVDDDKIVRLLHNNQLRQVKLKKAPQLFCNGEEALNYLQKKDRSNKNILVLLDLNMPVLDGWGFLECLKQEPMDANIYVIIITSSINKEDQLRSEKFPHVIGFCKKPMDLDCLTHIRDLEQIRHNFEQEHSPASEKNP